MRKYTTGGAIIGLLQVVDAAALYSQRGAVHGLSLGFAAVEFVWAIISLVVAFRVKHSLTRLLAIVFFGYNVLGWVLSAFIMDRAAPTVVPIGYVIFCGFFGLAYCLGSIYVASKP
jgi:hypothetical protein